MAEVYPSADDCTLYQSDPENFVRAAPRCLRRSAGHEVPVTVWFTVEGRRNLENLQKRVLGW